LEFTIAWRSSRHMDIKVTSHGHKSPSAPTKDKDDDHYEPTASD
jgi:hypothetical protein